MSLGEGGAWVGWGEKVSVDFMMSSIWAKRARTEARDGALASRLAIDQRTRTALTWGAQGCFGSYFIRSLVEKADKGPATPVSRRPTASSFAQHPELARGSCPAASRSTRFRPTSTHRLISIGKEVDIILEKNARADGTA